MNPFQHQQGRGYNPYNSRPGDCNRQQYDQFAIARSRPLLPRPDPPGFRMEPPRGQAQYNIGINFQQRLIPVQAFQRPNLWNNPESQYGNRNPNVGRGVRNQFPVLERGRGSQAGYGFHRSGQNYSGVQDSVRNGNMGGFGFNNAFGSGGQLNVLRNAAANLLATGGGQGFLQNFQHFNPGFSQRQSSNEAFARVNTGNQFHTPPNPLPSRDSHLKKSQRTKTLRYLDVNLNNSKVSAEVQNMSESSNPHLSNQNATNPTNQNQFDITRNSTIDNKGFLGTVSQIEEKSNIANCTITTPIVPLPRKTIEPSSSKESVIVGKTRDLSAVDCDTIMIGRSVGGGQNENKFMQGLSNMSLASSFKQDVHTKATPTTQSLGGTSDQDDCVIVNPPTCRETTPQQTPKCTPTKTQVQTLSKSPSSCQEESYVNTSQASPFQKLENPEIKLIETSPASPLQKIGHAETRTDKICEPQGNGSWCGSLPSGERDKTGLNAALISPKVSLHKQASSGGSSMDPVKDNASLGQGINTVGNSANNREKTVSKNPSDVAGGRFMKGDGAEIPRQRILSGESQRYGAKGWPARVEKKRHQSEDIRFKRENSFPLKHRESTDSGTTASQDQKQHSMHRSQSDSSQEITPESAQTYKEYKEAKQRLLEKEKEEQSRRRSQQRLSSSSSSETQGGGVRQGSVQKTAESYPLNTSRGGQAVDSMDMLDSKFCIVYGADVPSPEDDGDRHSDLDIDLDLDDSDDELLEAPSFLKDLENAITQPVPRTPPPKLVSSPAPGSPVPGAVSSSVSIPSTSRFAKFSLDSLLEEHTNKPQEQREYEEMHAELKESVKQGGFVKDTLEKQDDPSSENLLPEHQEQIEHLEMKKSVICPAHPGETIFCSSCYQQLFTPSITPSMCGFSPGESYIDKFLSSVQPRNFGALLSSEVLVNCLEKVTHPKPILKWLLFLLSVDGSHLAMDGCCKALEEYLYTQKVFHEDENPWAPCVEDILSIFMNCGASKEDVLPTDVFKDDEKISSLSKGITKEANVGLPPPNAGSLNRENLRLVLQVLALALQRRPKYDTSHLTALYVMLCRVALDKSLSSGIVNIEVQSCLGSILCCYPESEWKTCAIKLCSILPSLTEHHHNKVCLASLSPYGRRGQYLQRRVSYLMLRQLFDMEPSPEDKIENCKIRDLHQFLPHLQQLVTSDMYKLYSCITLIDLGVGNGVISPGEKDSLQYLSEQIKKISGDTRDDVRVLDRSRVKDQMVRLTSKWTLRLLTVGSNQRSIFSYTTSRAPQTLEIETVQASQTDESQSEPESDVEMADPLEEEPQSL